MFSAENTVFTHTKNSPAYKQLENFFSGELAALAKRDEYVFPYVVDLLARMASPSTRFVDEEKPLSVTYCELRQARRQGFGPRETSEFFRAVADEVFFYCGWTPERFENPRRPVGLDFYINYGIACYTNAAQIDWELAREDRAATLSFLADQYIDWLGRVHVVRERADKRWKIGLFQ